MSLLTLIMVLGNTSMNLFFFTASSISSVLGAFSPKIIGKRAIIYLPTNKRNNLFSIFILK